jgi:glycosyltransferase involved in cell wall biosynthesis
MRKKVLLVHPRNASFIQADIGILSRHFDVRVLDLGPYKRSLKNSLIVGYKLLRGVLWADMSFSWFAERHADVAVRLSRLFGRPSVVVVGGYEVAGIPEVGYGSMLDPKKAKMVRRVLERASVVIAVSKFIEEKVRSCSAPKRVEMIYNGVDTDRFAPRPPKEDLVVTVGVITKDTIPLKGFRTFVESAAKLPDVRFMVVGNSPDGAVAQLKATSPGNVEFTGFVSNQRIAEIYGRAKVYCQLSMYESFGVSLVESMSCGCVPVVASSGALPEVVGDSGLVVPYCDAEATARAVREALEKGDGRKARERAESKFSAKIREQEIVRVLGGLTA